MNRFQTLLSISTCGSSSGRLDRKIEIPLPNEMGRVEIIKIHASKINKVRRCRLTPSNTR